MSISNAIGILTIPNKDCLIKNNLLCKTGRLHYIHNFKDVENFLNGYYEEFLQLRREDKNFQLSESEFMSLKNQNLSLEEIKNLTNMKINMVEMYIINFTHLLLQK